MKKDKIEDATPEQAEFIRAGIRRNMRAEDIGEIDDAGKFRPLTDEEKAEYGLGTVAAEAPEPDEEE
jgi:hypothetical protein